MRSRRDFSGFVTGSAGVMSPTRHSAMSCVRARRVQCGIFRRWRRGAGQRRVRIDMRYLIGRLVRSEYVGGGRPVKMRSRGK